MVPLQQKIPNPNNRINSIKTRFTYRFLRALKAINNKDNGSTSTTSSTREIYERFYQVKLASNASMAAAVGSKRAWSRALLCKIKNRNIRKPHHHRHHALIMRRRRRSVSINGNPKKKKRRENICGGKAAKKLQKLVIPGGEGITMEIGSLLDETAHYIKCLTTQVQVMQNVLHLYSP